MELAEVEAGGSGDSPRGEPRQRRGDPQRGIAVGDRATPSSCRTRTSSTIPADLPSLLLPIRSRQADAVYGSRFQGGPHRVLYFWHYVGNRVLTLLSNMFTNLNLTDLETCYKLVRADLIKRLPLSSNQFGFEVGDYGAPRAGPRAHLGDPDLLQRSHLRRRKITLARRRGGAGSHPAVQPVRPRRPPVGARRRSKGGACSRGGDAGRRCSSR